MSGLDAAMIYLDKNPITIGEIVAVARHNQPVGFSGDARTNVDKARQLIDKWVQAERVVYGITTGFGAMCDVSVTPEDARLLQEKILVSHAAGIGAPLPVEVVRAIMAVRAHDLSMGYSGCRLETLEYLVRFLNAGVVPVIPEKGSVGASGDLAPTAHLGLVLIGRGEAFYDGNRLSGADALAAIGLEPLVLEAGEGLALINGTQVMTAIGTLVVNDAVRLSKLADIAAAMSLEVLMGSQSEFDSKIHRLRPHRG